MTFSLLASYIPPICFAFSPRRNWDNTSAFSKFLLSSGYSQLKQGTYLIRLKSKKDAIFTRRIAPLLTSQANWSNQLSLNAFNIAWFIFAVNTFFLVIFPSPSLFFLYLKLSHYNSPNTSFQIFGILAIAKSTKLFAAGDNFL